MMIRPTKAGRIRLIIQIPNVAAATLRALVPNKLNKKMAISPRATSPMIGGKGNPD